MKTILSYLLAVIAALGLYPMTAKVTDVNRTKDVVTVETATGYQYQFAGCSDWCEGDFITAIMWKNGTDNITDDALVTWHYSGWSDYAGDPLN